MQHMLEDYMAFVRGDGGEQISAVEVQEAVTSVVKTFEREGANVKVLSVPKLILQLKPNAFRRLLTNLISNAVRHGQLVEISGEIRDERLWLYVDDNGPGIPAEERDRVFDRFYRLDRSRTTAGSGLGLALVKAIAGLHGLAIKLEDRKPGLAVIVGGN